MEKVVALLAVALTVSVDCTSKEFFQTGLLLNWTESMETCRQNFTELVTMQSEEEYQQFWSYIRLYEGVYWIGLQFNSINNTWKWVNGNPTTYSHWAVPPTGAGCGAFNSSSGGWFILNCSYGLMSVCQGIITVGGNDPGKKCVFPFYYGGYQYFGCTNINNNNIPWCATTTDYPTDNKWGNCPFTVPPTTGGNSNGAPCQFPFKYHNMDYYSCTTDGMNSKELWCATVSNYDEDPKWGFCTTSDPTPPREISVDSVGDDSVSLSWGRPVGMDGYQYSFNITYSCSFWGHSGSTSAPSNSTVISNLRSGSEYVFNITTVQDTGSQSTPASISLYTKPSQPGEISVDFVGDDSFSLSWGSPVGMDGVQYSFNITYSCSFWGHSGSTSTPSNSIVISNLRSGSEYVFNITTVQDTGSQSTPASISLYTKPNEKRFYLKFVCSSTEQSVCEKEKQKVQQEFEARLAEQLKGLYWKLNWKEKEVKECIDEPEEDV